MEIEVRLADEAFYKAYIVDITPERLLLKFENE